MLHYYNISTNIVHQIVDQKDFSDQNAYNLDTLPLKTEDLCENLGL